MKADETKERIIKETIKLIREMNGAVDKVTIRKIAERSQVGVGLINHYFDTKDYLVKTCVQKIIGNIVQTFKMEESSSRTPMDTTQLAANRVIDFLMDNIQISTISILGDLNDPGEKDNSIGAVRGFAYCMSGGINTMKQMERSFFLLAILQESFLRRDVLYENIGVDFYDKEQRNSYINHIVKMIMEGIG